MHSANGFGLQSAIFYITMAAHAIWDEHHCLRIYNESNENFGAVSSRSTLTLPNFILNAARALAALPAPHGSDSDDDENSM